MPKISFFVYAVLGAFILLAPFCVSRYWLYMLTILALYVILVASLDLLYGYTGMINIAQGAFFGIGAYACGILQVKLGFSFWAALLMSVLFTAVFALIVGFPLLKTRGPYFALGSLALAAIVEIIIFNWVSLTGGYSLVGIPGPGVISFLDWKLNLNSGKAFYFLVLVFVFLTLFFLRRLVGSRVGKAFIAIREDEDLAESLGVNLLGYKLLAFTIASSLAAVAGGLYSGYMGAIEPSIAGYQKGFQILIMNIIGGPTTLVGYIIGPFLIWIFPEFLGAAEAYRPLIFGFILIIIIIFMPKGIAGKLRDILTNIGKKA